MTKKKKWELQQEQLKLKLKLIETNILNKSDIRGKIRVSEVVKLEKLNNESNVMKIIARYGLDCGNYLGSLWVDKKQIESRLLKLDSNELRELRAEKETR